MVANQSVDSQDNADMYCSPSPSNYEEYYYVHNLPPDIAPGHVMPVSRNYGPVTVPMVSTNTSPPVAMPMQVPPGHVVQEIVDENGTLRHVIISTQHPAGMIPLPPHSSNYGNDSNGTSQSQRSVYQNLQTNFISAHTNIPCSHAASNIRVGPSPPPQTYYKDERAQRQHNKLKKKLHDKQLKREPIMSKLLVVNLGNVAKERDMNSVETSEDGEESSVQDDEDSMDVITDILSSVQAPQVSELTPRSALLQWAPPTRLTEAACNENSELNFSEFDLTYEVLLSDKSKELKFKSIYKGASLSCRIQDLRPGQEYSVCIQVHCGELQGSATDPIVKFTTPTSEPDRPEAPKLSNRTKNSLQVRWHAVTDNGSQILYYTLDCDDGSGTFVEVYKGKAKQHTLQKLRPSTTYKLRVAAVNEMGKSLYSEVVPFCTYDNPPLPPDPPVLVDASAHTLHLQWNRRNRGEEITLQLCDPHNAYGYRNVYNGSDTHYLCSGLQHFTKYKFRLRAQNESGYSPWSLEIEHSTLPDRPAAPSKPIVKGKIHAHSFKLKWEPPTHTGGVDIENYVVEVNSGSAFKTVYTGNDTEAVCDKLTPGTTYQLRVCCISSGGRSNYSDLCTVTTDAICPRQCAPPNLGVKPKPYSIDITWMEPDYNGGAPVLCYEVEMSDSKGNQSLVCKDKQLQCSVISLSPGCNYSFKVRAVNRIGPSIWSESLSVTTASAPPYSPTVPDVIARSPYTVFVKWDPPHSNGSPITEYRLEMTLDLENYECVHHGPETSYEVKNLTPSTRYWFRIQASNDAGSSLPSEVTEVKTPPASPGVVSFTKYSAAPTTLTLHWNEPADNGSEITRYNIEIGDRIISTVDPCTEFTIDSLQADTHYKIRIQASNDVGDGPFSQTLKATTLRFPPAPPKLHCIGVGHNFLKLKWGEGKNNDYTQYCVEVANPRFGENQCVYKGTAFTCKVNKLQEITSYKFKINASNDAGEGEFSEEYEFTTTVAPPSTLKPPKIVEQEDKSYIVEWLAVRNSFTDPLIYDVQVNDNNGNSFTSVYKGPETKYLLQNLKQDTKYGVRICPIRVTSAGELMGSPTSIMTFSIAPRKTSLDSNVSVKPAAVLVQTTRSKNIFQVKKHIHNLLSMSERQCNLVYAIVLTVVGIVIAILSKTVYDYGA